jgi:hypothetical protein
MKRTRTAQSAPARRSLSEGGFFNLHASVAVLLCAAAPCSGLSATLLAFFRPDASSKVSQRTLSFSERVTYQRAIEEVYWRHRIWPKENACPKPSLDGVMTQAQLEKKVEDYLRNSQALEDYYKEPLSADQLQAEIDRMAQHTKQPDVLHELFEALGNDPFVVVECLGRPVLTERLVFDLSVQGEAQSFESFARSVRLCLASMATTTPMGAYNLPRISQGILHAPTIHGQPPAQPTRPLLGWVTRQSGQAVK